LFALQPVGVGDQLGIGMTASVSGLDLRPVARERRRRPLTYLHCVATIVVSRTGAATRQRSQFFHQGAGPSMPSDTIAGAGIRCSQLGSNT
jgi:hypothetical protein